MTDGFVVQAPKVRYISRMNKAVILLVIAVLVGCLDSVATGPVSDFGENDPGTGDVAGDQTTRDQTPDEAQDSVSDRSDDTQDSTDVDEPDHTSDAATDTQEEVGEDVTADGDAETTDDDTVADGLDVDLADGGGDSEWTIIASPLPDGGEFGASMAFTPADPDEPTTPAYLAISAPNDRSIGAVLVYTADDDGWTVDHTLRPDVGLGPGFGQSVGIFKETLIVGAPEVVWSGSGRGQAYWVDGRGGNWQAPEARPGEEPTSSQYGFAVATHKRNMIIGLPDLSRLEFWNLDQGGLDDDPWNTLISDDHDGQMGFSVACDEELMAVGAPNQKDGEEVTGAAFILERTESASPVYRANLTGPVPGRRFGHAVALDVPEFDSAGLMIFVVGAPGAAVGEGAVYIYEWVPGTSSWDPTLTIESPGGVSQFGETVALWDTTLAIGSEDGVFLYTRTSSEVWATRTLHMPSGIDSLEFGTSLVVSDTQLFVGAPGGDRVYVHELTD